MALQLAPIISAPYESLDITGNMGKGAQVGALQEKRQYDAADFQKKQKNDAVLPGLIQKYKSGDQGALMQIAQASPEMAQSIMQMEENKSQQALRGVQMGALQREAREKDLAAKRELMVQRMADEAAGYEYLQANLLGVEEESEKEKILQTSIKALKEFPMFAYPEAQAQLDKIAAHKDMPIKDVEEFIAGKIEINSIGKKPKDPIKVGAGETLVDANTMKPLFQADKQEKAPSGYRFKADGALEPIPGGAEAAKVDAETAADNKAVSETRQEASNQLQHVNDALKFMGAGDIAEAGNRGIGSGGVAQLAKMIKSTDAGTLDSMIKKLNSAGAIETITAMKQASKTGATGFGSLSAPELDLLLSKVSVLDVGLKPEVLAKNLLEVERHWKNVLRQLGAPKTGEIMGGHVFMGGDPNDPKSWKELK